MSETKLPSKLWGECVLTAAYLKDRTPTRTLKNKTPYEAYYGLKPDISHLRKIGCKAFILVQSEHRCKIYSQSVEGILVGYSPTSKAYQCYYPPTGRIIVSRNVSFIEAKDTKPRPYRPGITIGTDAPDDPNDTVPLEHHTDEHLQTGGHVNAEAIQDEMPNTMSDKPQTVIPHRSAQQKKPSAAGAEIQGLPYESHLERAKREIRERSEKNSDGQEQPIFGVAHDDPRTYRQAMKAYDAEKWDEGYDHEMASLQQHGVWTLVPRSAVPKG